MAKERSIFNLNGVDPVEEVSRHLTKKGKLEGSKKEKKALRSICPHHAMNRKGKVKVRIHEAGNKRCECDICRDRFKTGFYSDEEYDRAYRDFKEQISQAKLLTVAVGADKHTVQRVAELNLHVDASRKIMRNLRNIAQKQDKNKKGKKQKRERRNYGGWRTN